MRLVVLALLAGILIGVSLPLVTNDLTWTLAAQQACAAAFPHRGGT